MDGHISNSDDAEMNGARNSEMRIIDENPYDNTFRASVNGCKKCQGNGIVFPKRSNEPEICPKCQGHGFGDDDILMAPVSTCTKCLVM